MKAQDFRGFIEQLGDLTGVQRAALAEALAGQGSASEVVTLIDAQFSAAPACGHCKSERFISWGQVKGLRRYKCRDCHRTFNALTGTPLAHLHRRDAWLEYARAMVDRVSLRKAAKRAGVCLETSFRWRHRFVQPARDKRPSVVTGIVEADETVVLKSLKGSRKLVARAPRKRGGEPKKLGLSPDDYDIILIMRDRHKATSDHILPDFLGATFEAAMDRVVAPDSILVTDGRPSYSGFARDRGMQHVAVVASRGEHVRGGFHIQNVNAYCSRLKGWMHGFKGVASRYLANYLGWHRMIDRDGDRLTPRHIIAQAVGA